MSNPHSAVRRILILTTFVGCAAFTTYPSPPWQPVKLAGETHAPGAVGVGAAVSEGGVSLVGDGPLVAWNRGDGPAVDATNLSAQQVGDLPAETSVPVEGGNLITRTDFGDCRLHVEWLSPPGGEGQMAGNSGVLLQGRYELQVLNLPAPGGPVKDDYAAAIYKVKPPSANASNGAGEWQSYDVWFRAPRFRDGRKTEPARITLLWNGVLVHDDVAVDGTTGSNKPPEQPRPASDYQVGPLVLQAHATDADGPVRYRNVWVAPLGDAAADNEEWGEWTPLFDGKTLDGWAPLGGAATFAVEDEQIVGSTAPNTANTFLTTVKEYGDFELELEVKSGDGLNSGVQVRSTTADGTRGREARVTGYQVEVDGDPARSWSGGIYDEGGRKWLAPLTGDPAARDAYHFGEWNRYRVVARGPTLRVFVNDVPTAAVFDALRTSGLIGLQVHSVGDRADPLRVHWRNLRIRTPK